jgi:putative FmdB family regulatory protein
MPLYEFDCDTCHHHSEQLIRSSHDQPLCPRCGSAKMTKLLSSIAVPVIQGGKGSNRSSEPMPMPGNCGRPQCGSGGCMFGQ